MRPRRYERFVLIGLCWLYGRSEFPLPPAPMLAIASRQRRIRVTEQTKLETMHYGR